MSFRKSIVPALALAGIGGAMLVGATPAFAVSADIEPGSQTVAANVTAYWGAGWSGTAPYKVSFCYGNGSCSSLTTSSTSHTFSHAFNPCRATTYTQSLTVTDATGNHATSTAHTLVGNGTSC